jgi:hypothetical protein
VRHLLDLGRQDTKEHVSRRQGKEKEKERGNHSPLPDEPPTRYSVDITATGIDNWTALHFAARKGRVDVVGLLLQHNPPVPVNAVTKNGWSALMMASDKGYTEVVRLLLDGGADVSIRSSDGYSAYRVAKEGQHGEIVQMLLERVDKAQREQKEKGALKEKEDRANTEQTQQLVVERVDPAHPAVQEMQTTGVATENGVQPHAVTSEQNNTGTSS